MKYFFKSKSDCIFTLVLSCISFVFLIGEIKLTHSLTHSLTYRFSGSLKQFQITGKIFRNMMMKKILQYKGKERSFKMYLRILTILIYQF